MSTDRKIVIIGAGQAGGWAAATLRKQGFDGQVILIGAEPHRPYERPPLSKGVLKGDVEPESCYLHTATAFAAQNVDFRPSTSAEQIDLKQRRVGLSDGTAIGYEKLILCTGGHARTLDMRGSNLPGVLTLRTFEDAAVLGKHIRQAEPVVVVGGGWIGLEAAAVAREYGCPVTLLEAQERLCQRTVPPVLSDYLLELHKRHGVDVRLNAVVTEITEADGRMGVRLADGGVISAGTVVVGVGLIPNDQLAERAGLDCDRGILVDASCRTSDPHVFAAGDVAVTPTQWSAVPLRLESWQNAQEQGIAAAQAALGQDVHYGPLPWFWSDQYEVRIQIYGVPRLHADMVIRGDSQSDEFSALFVHGDQLIAAMGPGAARDLRTCKRIIEKRIPVDVSALADSGQPSPTAAPTTRWPR